MLRIGYVVETHPEDNSVDLVMPDNAERIVGAQVLALGASRRTGSVDLPTFKPRSPDKWDISEKTEQDLIAIVGRTGKSHVVLGFLFPQINQVLFDRDGLRVDRHESDVYSTLDKDGNFEWRHPSGTFVRVAEDPESEDLAGKDFDEGWDVDRNTDKAVHMSVEVRKEGELKAKISIDPDGNLTLESEGDLSVKTKGNVSYEIGGMFEMQALAMKFTAMPMPDVPGAALELVGPSMTHGGVNVGSTHVHSGVSSGNSESGPPN